ncbi:hypothetical protein ABT072_24065 [Streptomyces sp. NPDC002589]
MDRSRPRRGRWCPRRP